MRRSVQGILGERTIGEIDRMRKEDAVKPSIKYEEVNIGNWR